MPVALDLDGRLSARPACLAATGCHSTAFVYLRRFVSPLGVPALSGAVVQITAGDVLTAHRRPPGRPASRVLAGRRADG